MKKIPVFDANGNEVKNAEARQGTLTIGQTNDLGQMFREGNVPLMKPNRLEFLRDQFFKEFSDYRFPKHEGPNFYKVIQEARTFNSTSGERVSAARVVTYNPVMWQFVQQYGLKGELSFILHDPSLEPGYIPPPALREEDDDEDIQLFLK